MRDNINNIVAVILLFVGMILMIGGLLLHIGGSEMPTRAIIIAGAFMVSGVVLYAQFRDDERY